MTKCVSSIPLSDHYFIISQLTPLFTQTPTSVWDLHLFFHCFSLSLPTFISLLSSLPGIQSMIMIPHLHIPSTPCSSLA